VDLTGITVEDLLAAVRRALAVAEPLPPVGDVVKPFIITIRGQIALIERMLESQSQISFTQLLQRRSRVEIAVTFLAVLELARRRRIEVMQERLFGEIFIQRGAEAVGATPILMDDAEFGEEEDGEEA
jgi:segregation and condensation protein A